MSATFPRVQSRALSAAGISGGAAVTVSFGTAVAMWGFGFLARLPDVSAGTEVAHVGALILFVGMIAIMFVGGMAAGRFGAGGWRDAAVAGLITGAINLLVIGSVLKGDGPEVTLRNALIWVPGSLLAATLIMGAGGVLGMLRRQPLAVTHWLGHFAKITAAGTLLLIMVGGTVTGFDAGLAVVDWPNTEGTFMFLYPLSKMTGGVYFEHSHRLIGSLIGLTTVVLAVYLQFYDDRKWVKWLGWFAVVLVVVQGVLGGLRVTGYLTFSTDPNDTAPSILLAVIHGVLGQVFFSVLIWLAVVTSRAWGKSHSTITRGTAGTDQFLGFALYGLLVMQLVLGALVRHLMGLLQADDDSIAPYVESLLSAHIVSAMLVTLLAIAAGVRSWGLYGHVRAFHRTGLTLVGLVCVQVVLGILAYVAVDGGTALPATASEMDVFLTTTHQTVGAVLLGLSVILIAWQQRVLRPAPISEPHALRPTPPTEAQRS